MGLILATMQVTRPYSSILAFLSVLVPVFARTNELAFSLQKAIPLLLISMCTFIINDLDDIEKDRINHPTRPLPSGELKPPFVAVLYYICLLLALLTTRFFAGPHHVAFLYYLLLVLCISYTYVVEYLPIIKPFYVAAVSSIPVFIVVANYPSETSLYRVATAFFFFLLGRELCKDLLDRRGDPISLLHQVHPRLLAILAFGLQIVGFILLLPKINDLLGLIDLLLMLALFVLSIAYWFRFARATVATALMKATIYCGLYFLI